MAKAKMGMLWSEARERTEELGKRFEAIVKFSKLEEKKNQLVALEKQMAQEGFWDSQEEAQAVISQLKTLKEPIQVFQNFSTERDDLQTMAMLLGELDEPEKFPDYTDFVDQLEKAEKKLEKLELQSFLSGPLDQNNAIITIHSGAGGTEACDWADMVLRMYLRWAEIAHFQTEIQEIQPGEEAGISRATFRLLGDYAYGYAKGERGVHRLVRISPFDAGKRRHTSFCSVDVIGEIDDDVTVDIRDDDLRIDTYRASGKGGQHVNKTESAVRITHLPTNIVVTCQNERSQIKNREMAMKTLRARVYEKRQDEKRSEMEKFYGEKGEIGWGNQIRSYVFQPYQMVKDLRTGHETGNIQAVMDGNIGDFIEAWLREGGPTRRLSGTTDE